MHEVIEHEREERPEREEERQERGGKADPEIGKYEERAQEGFRKRRIRRETRATAARVAAGEEVGDDRHERKRRERSRARIATRTSREEALPGIEAHDEHADKARDDGAEGEERYKREKEHSRMIPETRGFAAGFWYHSPLIFRLWARAYCCCRKRSRN